MANPEQQLRAHFSLDAWPEAAEGPKIRSRNDYQHYFDHWRRELKEIGYGRARLNFADAALLLYQPVETAGIFPAQHYRQTLRQAEVEYPSFSTS